MNGSNADSALECSPTVATDYNPDIDVTKFAVNAVALSIREVRVITSQGGAQWFDIWNKQSSPAIN